MEKLNVLTKSQNCICNILTNTLYSHNCVLKAFRKVFFYNKCLFYVKFNVDSKYLSQFVHKLNLKYIQLLSSLYAMTKNPISIFWDNLTIFSCCLNRICSFCREFKYLPHFCKIIWLYFFKQLFSVVEI